MSDFVIHQVDNQTVERIKALAGHRRWSVNDVALHALRQGLGLSAAGQIFTASMLDPGELVLAGHWEASEKAAFQEALQALAVTRPASRLAAPR